MADLAQVVGLETQLTVPTRNRAHLFDLWVSVRWLEARDEWASVFSGVARRHNAANAATGTLQLVVMSELRGWIVARGVNLQVVSPTDIEALVRRVVAQVTAQLTGPHGEDEPASAPAAAPRQWRSGIAAASTVLVNAFSSPRRRSEADATSGS